MKSQLSRTETIVKNITGKSTKPYFRAPYEATNQNVLNTGGNAGYTYTFHWTIDTLDWTGNSATTIYNRLTSSPPIRKAHERGFLKGTFEVAT